MHAIRSKIFWSLRESSTQGKSKPIGIYCISAPIKIFIQSKIVYRSTLGRFIQSKIHTTLKFLPLGLFQKKIVAVWFFKPFVYKNFSMAARKRDFFMFLSKNEYHYFMNGKIKSYALFYYMDFFKRMPNESVFIYTTTYNRQNSGKSCNRLCYM